MAAFAPDPIFPGLRFFVHGGRAKERPCGDLFDVRLSERTALSDVYQITQRALGIVQKEKTRPPCATSAHNRHLKMMTGKDILRRLQWRCLAAERAGFSEGRRSSSPPTTRADSLRCASMAWLQDILHAPCVRGDHAVVLQFPKPPMELDSRMPTPFSLTGEPNVGVDPNTWSDHAAAREYNAHIASALDVKRTLHRVFTTRDPSPQGSPSCGDAKHYAKKTHDRNTKAGALSEIPFLRSDVEAQREGSLSECRSFSALDPPEGEKIYEPHRQHYLLRLLKEVSLYQKCEKLGGNRRKLI
ncbi:unnamed protein product [Phytomonas sp. Hart1]|nr:unnamed protein product [Phytomonas sp. Hart1]|eukprot:CCW72198.1 unnamed protein product [Phytomonas sp. isolate Hart1]